MNLHKKISYLKSTIRIIGYLALIINIYLAVVILVASEILGYVEEIKE